MVILDDDPSRCRPRASGRSESALLFIPAALGERQRYHRVCLVCLGQRRAWLDRNSSPAQSKVQLTQTLRVVRRASVHAAPCPVTAARQVRAAETRDYESTIPT